MNHHGELPGANLNHSRLDLIGNGGIRTGGNACRSGLLGTTWHRKKTHVIKEHCLL